MNIPHKTGERIKVSGDVVALLREVYALLPEEDSHKEVFYVVGLNSQNVVLFIDLITLGTINRASPVIRECYRQAIIKNAVSIIACHNHPSGDTTPSSEDKQFTRELADAGKVLGVRLLDHIILGTGFYSFTDNNLREGVAQ